MSNLLDLAGESGDKAILAKIRATEEKVENLREQKATWAERAAFKRKLLELDVNDIRNVLAATTGISRASGRASVVLPRGVRVGVRFRARVSQLR